MALVAGVALVAAVVTVLFWRSRTAGPIWGCPYCHTRFRRARDLADHEQQCPLPEGRP